MPPPPANPMIVDIRTFMSHRYIVKEMYGGTIWGITAYIIVCRRSAPVALTASNGPGAILSTCSEYNLVLQQCAVLEQVIQQRVLFQPRQRILLPLLMVL